MKAYLRVLKVFAHLTQMAVHFAATLSRVKNVL